MKQISEEKKLREMNEIISNVVRENKGNMYRLAVIILLIANLFTTIFMGNNTISDKTMNDLLMAAQQIGGFITNGTK